MKYVGESAPAWSFPGKNPTKPYKVEEKVTDPVIVDVDAKSRPFLYENPPAISFPKAGRMKESASAPNLKLKPQTAQELTASKTFKNLPKRTFPNAERFQVLGAKLHHTPGPADYRPDGLKKIAARMPNFSFGYKHDANTGVDINPTGPTTYHINYSQREPVKAVLFGKDEKVLLKEIIGTAYTPGPGAYHIREPRPNTASKKGTFGHASRVPSAPSNKSTAASTSSPPLSLPNPDIHTIAYKAEKIREQFEARNSVRPQSAAARKLNTDAQMSGGGTENIGFNGNKPNAPAFKFGSGVRRPLTGITGSGELGPGAYFGDKSLKTLRPLTANPSFPRSVRKPLSGNQDVPGPGAYLETNIPVNLPNESPEEIPSKSLLGGPMYTIRAKFPSTEMREAAAIPGPGEYDYDHNYALGWGNGKFHRFGTSIRPKENTKTYKPGPGAYEINRNILDTEGTVFPKSKRSKTNANTDVDVEVGPGHYQLKPTVPQLQPYEHKRMLLTDKLHEMFV